MVAKLKVAIVGGGIAGLSIAWHLSERFGHQIQITLFDKQDQKLAASKAAAGMLTPAWEVVSHNEDLIPLFKEALNYYDEFVAKLTDNRPAVVDYQKKGSFLVAVDANDALELDRYAQFLDDFDLNVESITKEKLLNHEPLLNPEITQALYSSHEAWIDNRKLLSCLIKSLKQRGVEFYAASALSAPIFKNNQWHLEDKQQTLAFDWLVCTTGAGFFEGFKDFPKIIPIKGQALDLKMTQSLKIEHVIRTLHQFPVYLVPRNDGRLTIGATSEDRGWDNQKTAGALMDLLYGAFKLLPCVYELEFVDTWVGHRPASRDFKPIFRVDNQKQLIFANGFYRHGILLAPVVAKKLVREAFL